VLYHEGRIKSDARQSPKDPGPRANPGGVILVCSQLLDLVAFSCLLSLILMVVLEESPKSWELYAIFNDIVSMQLKPDIVCIYPQLDRAGCAKKLSSCLKRQKWISG
jgi:hypothetical protein